MNVYETGTVDTLIRGNSYVGRGIIVGLTPDKKNAVAAYFIMGRSENSRNRVFVESGDDVTIYPFDESKVEDPSLIIYSPVRRLGDKLIVTNGDQTDTVYSFLSEGKSFEAALDTREFEPDRPNFTPRISALLELDKAFTYKMNILKSGDPEGTVCSRFNFSYTALPGLGHFIHTYVCDGNPIPTFTGEPERIETENDIDAFTDKLWNALDENNKISLYVRYINLADGTAENRMINKNHK